MKFEIEMSAGYAQNAPHALRDLAALGEAQGMFPGWRDLARGLAAELERVGAGA